eukprot:CAMPEP_0184687378 /NCGR_PEP_ID=MMETSP0312-20130426/26105_1 /TAXON_ID=31354 /ORGANISM="Compsopogon coeruleus, Strain SAG 36.94" /LENGTH=72 /DNA_ID=CAMNT_0027143429 /DNA_START=65 /DNA_END=283 /DNA_ORIENTATION=-
MLVRRCSEVARETLQKNVSLNLGVDLSTGGGAEVPGRQDREGDKRGSGDQKGDGRGVVSAFAVLQSVQEGAG